MTGVQALVRLPIDQARQDLAANRRTGTFISGYPGSPLGVLDNALAAAKAELEPYGIVHQPGINEELAAVAVWGSQQTPRPYAGGRAGVVGMWYGKAPGVDRSGDSFRHGNFMGAHPQGGVIAIAGDDPSAKSSTLPTDSQSAFYDLAFPVIVPSTVSDIIDLGLHAVQLSRFSGNWVAMKLVTNLCDGLATVQVRERRGFVLPPVEVDGRAWRHHQLRSVLTPISLEQEAELHNGRLAATKAYLEANEVNVTVRRSVADRLGIVSYGKPFTDLMEALDLLGLDPGRPGVPPIRILKLGASYPLPEQTVREFAAGLSEILVVEEKRSFVETQIKEILYPQVDRPAVLGKLDAASSPLVPVTGELNQARITSALQSWLRPHLTEPDEIMGAPERTRQIAASVEMPRRPAAFCSGCPHSRSTVIPAGALSGGGCGCHSLVYIEPRHRNDDLFSVVPMGTEGAEWIGLAPFVDTPHMFQNLGDGTFFHSGVNAVRACIDAGVNMTFKLLFNSAIAMTGGQAVPGARGVQALTKELEAMGVALTIVCTEDVRKYRRRQVAGNAVVWPREQLDEAQAKLAKTPGVTVLLYDQYCAAEARRLRKRALMPVPPMHVVINEAVCEGCGDCQTKSNCLSVVSVATDLGRKTQIQGSSCNRDYSCLAGDCPSFVTVVPKRPGVERTKVSQPGTPSVPEPTKKAVVPEDPRQAYGLLLAGIGGTGVMTTNQILAMAAMLDGYHCVGLDQTGLAQKGGPVLSHLRISRGDDLVRPGATAPGKADAYLVFDPVVGVTPVALDCLSPDRTSCVVNSDVAPTRDMIVDEAMREGPDISSLVGTIAAACVKGQTASMPALNLSEAMFADHMQANLLLLGAAYQKGLVPLSVASVRAAIKLNGVSVEKNLAAFELGRDATRHTTGQHEETRLGMVPVSPSKKAHRQVALLTASLELPADLPSEVLTLAAELFDYGGVAPSRRYLDLVCRAAVFERSACPGALDFTAAVARNFFKVIAYKDEYEVARLQLKERFQAGLDERFGAARVYYHLHPPTLRAMGLRRKIRVRSTLAVPMFEVLRRLRVLRSTSLDPFGRTRARRRERCLIDDYERGVLQVGADIATSPERALTVARLPEQVRGYESVKEAAIDELYRRLEALLRPAALAGAPSGVEPDAKEAVIC